ALDLFQANALQIHVNVPQELVMPEGDRDFTNWLTKIEAIVQAVEVPVIVKEVGFGMSQETLEKLTSIGVQAADVSGQGGTSFTQIENARRKKRELSFLDDRGQSTVISLLESQNWQKKLTILGSGGVRNSLDIVKGLALGAKSMGVAGTILASLMSKNGLENTLALVQQWQEEVKMLYTLLGKKTTEELPSTALILDPVLVNWCHNRGIDSTVFAKR
ncbi:type 2 isopentenyl-diphosphate Delta-isomerase, partial [Enterococcus mundtii]|uniref:alpha-hydroxy-acid oxidizing protein n=1 Tax=Enterococcus mundtii TaxID=53346 RepID=UPI00129CAD1C